MSLSETLQNELADDHIGVSVVCPSFFKTNLTESMRTPDPNLASTMAELLNTSSITADDIADQIFDAVEKNRFYVLPHLQGSVAWRLKRFLPRSLYTTFIRARTARMKTGQD